MGIRVIPKVKRKNRWPASDVSKPCLRGNCGACYKMDCRHKCHDAKDLACK